MKNRPYLFIFFTIIAVFPTYSLAHGVTTGDQELLTNGGLITYVLVGAKHMLTGFDHLLFLTGIVFYFNSTNDIIKFITIFTIGHCIPLILATYLNMKADEHLIDAVIALSVVYKGFENLSGFETVFGKKPPNLFLAVLVFGLIHGFGLSTRLQSFDMGIDQILRKILCFNLGVEIGQIEALIPIIFLITNLRKSNSYAAFHKAMNTYLIIAGIGLFFYQLYGYYLTIK